MISVTEAKNIVKNCIKPLPPIEVTIQQAAGCVLAEDVFASIDIPAFNQSGMDGYAFCYEDYNENNYLEIAGEVAAGQDVRFDDLKQKAIRIFTGAPVPNGADTVVMQEKVLVENNRLIIKDEIIAKGSNVRLQGSEIKAGALALEAGTFLSAAAVGFLAGLGSASLKVYPKPKVSVIVTGKELQQPGKPLQPGQVYESNSVTITAALQQMHIKDVNVVSVDDNINILQKTLEDAIQQSSVVLITGGVSVGDYDFVLEAAALCGVTTMFHKVKQKPGKPLFFGKKDETVIFGLPGNPSSVLTCFYEYVVIGLEQLTRQNNVVRVERLPLAKSFSKKAGLTHFLKGTRINGKAMPLDGQESFKLSSFATADCLICLEEDRSDYWEGEVVEVHILPL